jgi:TonB family protein
MAPAGWFTARNEPEPRSIMTITLGGGAPGPANTGMTPMAARPVQSTAPIATPARPEPIRPPAARTPEMVIPRENATPPRRTTPSVNQAPPDARGTTPTRGAQTSGGQGIAETGARGQGFGLSSGGGGGTGSRLDVADFCCPEYIQFMIERVRSNWVSRAEVPGQVMVMFTIERNGRIRDIKIEQSSGYLALDMNAQRALVSTAQLPALPSAFPNPSLTVHLNFEYTR